jgi:putative membrane protein
VFLAFWEHRAARHQHPRLVLQWPIRAFVLLLVAALPLGLEMANFGKALSAAVLIGLLGTLLIWPLKLVLGPAWAITSLGG